MGLADDAAWLALERGRLAEHESDSCESAVPLHQTSDAARYGSDDEGAPHVPRRWRGRPPHQSSSISDGCASDAACRTSQSVLSSFSSPSGEKRRDPSPRPQHRRTPRRRCPACPRKRRVAREAPSLCSTTQPDEPRWAVDRIVNSRRRKGKLFYRLRWEDTWEPAESFYGSADTAIAEFLASTNS